MAPRRPRTYAAEYRRRIERNPGLPSSVQRGHGQVPIKIARGLEAQRKGRPRALPVATQEKYRAGIARYERENFGGHLLTGRTLPRRLPTEQLAWEYIDYITVPRHYAEVYQESEGVWRARTLR